MVKNNITLIGMPGAGKSTVGVLLAKVLGYDFVDPDLLIQKKEGMLLHEIISKKGDEEFLRIESRIHEELELHHAIIAPGGSVCYEPKAMEHLKEISTIVYLKLPYEVVSKRVENAQRRGVVLKEGWTLKDLFEEREPLYVQYADIIIDADMESPEFVMAEICDRISDNRR